MSVFVSRAQSTTVIAPPAGTRITVIVSRRGPPGPAGQGGGSVGYEHTQLSPAATWNINHNLGYRPSVSVFSVGGVEVNAEVVHLSNNQTQVSFNTPYAGFARCV